MHVKSTNPSKRQSIAPLAMLSKNNPSNLGAKYCFSVVFVSSLICSFLSWTKSPSKAARSSSVSQAPKLGQASSSHRRPAEQHVVFFTLVNVSFLQLQSKMTFSVIVVLLSVFKSTAVAFLLNLLLLVVPGTAQMLQQPVQFLADAHSSVELLVHLKSQAWNVS